MKIPKEILGILPQNLETENQWEVKKYKVWFLGNGEQSKYSYSIAIYLFGEEGRFLGKILFWKDFANAPHDTQGPDGEVYMFLPPWQYTAVIDLLRNEKPLYLSAGAVSFLTTTEEPVGVGENKSVPRIPFPRKG